MSEQARRNLRRAAADLRGGEEHSYGKVERLFARVDENHVVCRFCTSWATREEDMRELLQILKECRLASIS